MTSVRIVTHPYRSAEATTLLSALDQELEEMYPDWPDLPHPGSSIGLDPATEIGLDGKSKHVKQHQGTDQCEGNDTVVSSQILEGLDFDDSSACLDTNGRTDEIVKFKSTFFVAFLSSDPRSQPKDLGVPMGCVAILDMPYFPYQHPPEMYAESLRPQITQQISAEKGIRTAQLKRMYVAKAYRSTSISKLNSKPFRSSVAEALVQHLEGYAKTSGVDRLVLETGERQIGAARLYGRLGWTRVAHFGDYVSSSQDVGGVSVCYQKML